MTSLMLDIHRTVERAMSRSGLPLWRILKTLGISRAWYYRHLSFSPLLDGRFNPFAAGSDEWIVIGHKHKHPGMSFREIAYTLMDLGSCILVPGNGVKDPEEKRSHNALEPDHIGVHPPRARKEAG